MIMTKPLVALDVEKETEKAIRFLLPSGRGIWVPKSVITDVKSRKHKLVVYIAEWFCEKNLPFLVVNYEIKVKEELLDD